MKKSNPNLEEMFKDMKGVFLKDERERICEDEQTKVQNILPVFPE